MCFSCRSPHIHLQVYALVFNEKQLKPEEKSLYVTRWHHAPIFGTLHLFSFLICAHILYFNIICSRMSNKAHLHIFVRQQNKYNILKGAFWQKVTKCIWKEAKSSNNATKSATLVFWFPVSWFQVFVFSVFLRV